MPNTNQAGQPLAHIRYQNSAEKRAAHAGTAGRTQPSISPPSRQQQNQQAIEIYNRKMADLNGYQNHNNTVLLDQFSELPEQTQTRSHIHEDLKAKANLEKLYQAQMTHGIKIMRTSWGKRARHNNTTLSQHVADHTCI